ncbi:HMG-Y-related protein A-like [Cocos nucifera]|uniref:HMG-Y-related protein A-like n=1 Tax=Cocos nucifera TaxID=13894 RepID=A0A8K0N4F9_COCNU|nr:HMG-Y-related protein A-like [Cocos nucifera]
MAAEDVGKPPTQPRRRTPDHPPYAVMIGAAIRHLAEEGGSTMAAISHYIRSNYDDLPDGHDRLLPYYLGKLTSHGEFVMTAPGRFLVADQAAAAPGGSSKPMQNKDAAAPGGSSKPMQNKDADSTQSKPHAHEGDVVESKSNANQVGDVESLGYVLALPWESPPVTVPVPVKKGGGEDGGKPASRRRGRPPKVRSNAGGVAQDKEEENDGKDRHVEPEATPTQAEEAGKDSSSSAPKRRGRGRPPKRKWNSQ